jgi:hypothetical protein
MSRPRIDLSGSQVAASVLAAMTGAVAASYLGIAGTIVGAAVMSVASTAVAAVYRHYLARSHERLRAAAVVIVPRGALTKAGHRGQQRAAGESTQATGSSARPAGDPARKSADSAPTMPDPARPARSPRADEAETEVFASAGSLRCGQYPDRPAGQPADGGSRPDEAPTERLDNDHSGRPDDTATERLDNDHSGRPDDNATVLLDEGHSGPLDEHATQPQDGDRSGPADPVRGPGRAEGRPGGVRRWALLAGAALAVFLFVMGGITAIELVAGKPLDSVLHGQSGSGTSIGHLVGGNHSGRPDSPARPKPLHPAPSVRPTGSPVPSPSPSRSPSPAPSPTPSPSPSPSSPSASLAPSAPA